MRCSSAVSRETAGCFDCLLLQPTVFREAAGCFDCLGCGSAVFWVVFDCLGCSSAVFRETAGCFVPGMQLQAAVVSRKTAELQPRQSKQPAVSRKFRETAALTTWAAAGQLVALIAWAAAWQFSGKQYVTAVKLANLPFAIARQSCEGSSGLRHVQFPLLQRTAVGACVSVAFGKPFAHVSSVDTIRQIYTSKKVQVTWCDEQ